MPSQSRVREMSRAQSSTEKHAFASQRAPVPGRPLLTPGALTATPSRKWKANSVQSFPKARQWKILIP